MKPDIQPPTPTPAARFIAVAELAPSAESTGVTYPQWVDRYALAVMEADGYAPSALTRETDKHAA
jgi:hypothetical protein